MNRDHTFPPPGSRLTPPRCLVAPWRIPRHPPFVFPFRTTPISLPVAPVRRGGPKREVRRSLVGDERTLRVPTCRKGRSRRRNGEQLANIERANRSGINTSAFGPNFLNSLIMNNLKSIRISTGDNNTCRINTSGWCASRSFRINTSKNPPGEGYPLKHFLNIAASRRTAAQPSSSSAGSPARAAFAAAITLSAVSVGMKS